MEVLKGKTSTGFEFEVDKERLQNYELLEAIAEEETGSAAASVKVLNLLLGDDAKRLKEHVRNEKGFVPLDALKNEIVEIFQSQKDLKN